MTKSFVVASTWIPPSDSKAFLANATIVVSSDGSVVVVVDDEAQLAFLSLDQLLDEFKLSRAELALAP